jgi:4-hydroxybenzoate polyprenyltransferase
MNKLKEYIKLIRYRQWYKNLVIFLPIIFVGQLFNVDFLFKSFIGLIALCLVSSANYVINDIFDREKDKQHPEKKDRPIALGSVKTWEGVILAIILLISSLWISYKLNFTFFIITLVLFVITFLYSVKLKQEAFVDILIISVNFVLRAVAGGFVLNLSISPWLILCPFFLSLFISIGKREADIILLKENAVAHKVTAKYYTKPLVNALVAISTSSLIISYSLYSFLSNFKGLLLTLPFALYTIFRYLYLIYSGSEIARHPEVFYKDKRLLVGILIWVVSVGLVIYLF